MYLDYIANKRISNISITHERIITQKRINKAFRIWHWQESCSGTTWKKALACASGTRTTVWEPLSRRDYTFDGVLLWTFSKPL